MGEVLVPVDAEPEVVAELAQRMPAFGFAGPVGTKIPETRPEEFIRVVAVGGSARDLVSDSHTLVVEGFAVNETRAQRMCAFAIAGLQAAGRDGRIGAATSYGVSVFALPQNLPMPSVPDRFRFTATVSVDLRRTTV